MDKCAKKCRGNPSVSPTAPEVRADGVPSRAPAWGRQLRAGARLGSVPTSTHASCLGTSFHNHCHVPCVFDPQRNTRSAGPADRSSPKSGARVREGVINGQRPPDLALFLLVPAPQVQQRETGGGHNVDLCSQATNLGRIRHTSLSPRATLPNTRMRRGPTMGCKLPGSFR